MPYLTKIQTAIQTLAAEGRDLRTQARATSHLERYNLKSAANSIGAEARQHLLAYHILRGRHPALSESPNTRPSWGYLKIVDLVGEFFEGSEEDLKALKVTAERRLLEWYHAVNAGTGAALHASLTEARVQAHAEKMQEAASVTLTREQIEAKFEAASGLVDMANDYAEARGRIDPDFPTDFNIEDIDEDGIDIEWEELSGCSCHPEYETHRSRITLDDLLNTDFNALRAEMAERKRREDERRKVEAERRVRAQENREKAQLQSLLTKYPRGAA